MRTPGSDESDESDRSDRSDLSDGEGRKRDLRMSELILTFARICEDKKIEEIYA